MNKKRLTLIIITHQSKSELIKIYAYNLRIISNIESKQIKKDFNVIYRGIWEISIKDIEEGNIFLFYKPQFFQKAVSILINVIKKYNKIVLFDTDDYYLDIPVYSSSQHLLSKKRIKRFINNIKKTDHITVSTEYLKNIFLKFNSSTEVIPNTLNLNVKTHYKKSNSDVVNILLTSNDNLKLINFKEDFLSCLKEIKNKRGNKINLILLGRFYNINIQNKIFDEVYEKMSPDKYFNFLSKKNIHIGLVPLGADEDPQTFKVHCCKSNIKFLEFASFSIAGIYSDIEPYKFIKNRKEGIIVKNSKKDWIKAINLLIDKPALRKQIAISAYSKLHKYFTKQISQKYFYKILSNYQDNPEIKFENKYYFYLKLSIFKIRLFFYLDKYITKIKFVLSLIISGNFIEFKSRILKLFISIK